jgi:Ca2+-binding RTX toxin-like protein
MTTTQTVLTSGNDTYIGSTENDNIFGLAGNDIITGSTSDDVIKAGEGDDLVVGGLGSDEVFGGAGDDILLGLPGDDVLKGESGDDIIVGGFGSDTLKGGKGNDTLIADENDVFVSGGQGFDTIMVNDSNNDGIVNVDFTDSSMESIEAIIGDGQGSGDTVNATVNLNKILFQSQDDSDAATPDTDNTFLAIGIDSLIIEANNNWLDNGEMSLTTTDLDTTAETQYLEMLGITQAVDLYAYTFTKANGDSVEIITDLGLDEIFDSNSGEDLDTAIDVV